MRLARCTTLGLILVTAAAVMTGCLTSEELAEASVEGEVAVVEAGAEAPPPTEDAAAQLARLAEARQPTRSEEGGVTVIRGAMPPALAAMAATPPATVAQQSPVPVAAHVAGAPSGGSLVAAALSGGGAVQTAAAPGALASGDALARLQAQPATPVAVAALDDSLDHDVAPAAGGAAVVQLTDSGDPLVDEIRERAAHSPVSIAELEARGATRMTTDEIVALTVGNTVTHTNADTGFSAATYYDPNGQSRLINDGRGLPSRYQISDGARCRIDSQGIGVCALLYQEGDTTWVCDQRDQGMCNWYISRIETGFIGG